MGDRPPSPKAILRGHKAQVHAAAFVRDNGRLVTGDAEGFVVFWDLSIMRPRAVWRAHESAILGVQGWGSDKLITHGRDHKLVVWQVSEADEGRLSTKLPLEDTGENRPQPWILHLLEVNTLNFCAFAACPKEAGAASLALGDDSDVLVAVPHTLASDAIDIYTLPSQARIHTVKSTPNSGMAMAVSLIHQQGALVLLAAFENGFASVQRLEKDGKWTTTYRSQPHSQPILSLTVHPDKEYFLTSGADAIVAKHPIPASQREVSSRVSTTTSPSTTSQNPPFLLSQAFEGNNVDVGSVPPRTDRRFTWQPWEHALKVVSTKHAGQQSLRARDDGRIFATAGWDANVRVYSSKSMKELAVLQWHKVGCYAVAISDVLLKTSLVDMRDMSTREKTASEAGGDGGAIVSRGSGALTVKERRVQQAQAAHWVAAGAKDGKVSLWEIF